MESGLGTSRLITNPFRGARYSNVLCTIGWCLDRFQRYDGTSMLLIE